MKTIFFSTNSTLIKEWMQKYDFAETLECYDLESLYESLSSLENFLIIADYDTLNNAINKILSSGIMLKKLIVLESVPEIITGKMLIQHGIKAYGNSRMLQLHYKQMIEMVQEEKVWTYPELTASLVKNTNNYILSKESMNILYNRLTQKEYEVVFTILDGLTNNAIASKLQITTRTVKAHISSIFSKLHVNDRIGLVLLLK